MVENQVRYPEVIIPNVEKVNVAVKADGVRVSFDVKTAGPEVLKLIWLKLTGQVLDVIIRAPQAEKDLQIQEVVIKTGEVA